MSHTRVEGMTTDVNRFARCGEKGVLALLSDSTNVEKDGHTISSQEIAAELARITEEPGDGSSLRCSLPTLPAFS
jgi:ribonuclease J